MSLATHLNESCHTHQQVRAHIWMRHGTHMNAGRWKTLQHTATTATHCNHCNILQHTATHCNMAHMWIRADGGGLWLVPHRSIWVLSSQGKRPYISVKEPYISSKVPCISAEESIEAYGCYHLKAINPISPQKRPTFLKKRCAYPQKSRKFVEGVCGWCPSTPIDRCRALSRVYRTLFRKCRSHLRRCVAGVA